MKHKKYLPKHGFGSFLKGAGQFAANYGKGMADSALSVFGATDVINDGHYKGAGAKTFKGLSKVTGAINPIVGQVAATALGGPLAGQAMGMVQGQTAGIGANNTPEAQAAAMEQYQQYSQRYQQPQRTVNQGGTSYFAKGGSLPVEGIPTEGGYSKQLNSDTQQFVGRDHEQGGIPIDTNNDGAPEAEVEGNEINKQGMIYSDRIKPSKAFVQYAKSEGINVQGAKSYAKAAEKVAKMQGKMESKLTSTNGAERKTGELMLERMQNVMNIAFADQEQNKR